MRDILYFVELYVPKRLFDLKLASEQQRQLLLAVQNGKRYFIIRAPRKGGKTILVAIVAVWLTLRDQTYRFFIVSGSESQAKWLYDYCKAILWPNGPEFAERREFFKTFLKREPRATITEYKAGGWIMYTAATSRQVNAPTSDGQAMDEFVLIPNQIVEEAWPMNRSSKKPMRFLLSTATDGKENTDAFLDLLDDCEPGRPLHEMGWIKIEWESKDSPHLNTEAALDDSRSATYFLSEDMYRTQYRGGLPRRAGRVFPRTFIREMFVAPDPDNPGFLIDGTPYDPKKLVFMGEGKGGIDWGFDHDTVLLEGYRGLGGKIAIMKMVMGSGTSPSDWADQVEKDTLEYNLDQWFADASGAFQNQEVRLRGIRITPRAFQRRTYGKEWMVGVAYFWLSKRMIVAPDTPEFATLKRQLLKWKRGSDGKIKKGDDHSCDGFICLLSGWDPRYYEQNAEPVKQPGSGDMAARANDWDGFNSGERAWMPKSWEDNQELRKEIWKK